MNTTTKGKIENLVDKGKQPEESQLQSTAKFNSKDVDTQSESKENKSQMLTSKSEIVADLEKSLFKRELECKELKQQIMNIHTYLQSVEYTPVKRMNGDVLMQENANLKRELALLKCKSERLSATSEESKASKSSEGPAPSLEAREVKNYTTLIKKQTDVIAELEESLSKKNTECSDLKQQLLDINTYLQSSADYESKPNDQRISNLRKANEELQRQVTVLKFQNGIIHEKLQQSQNLKKIGSLADNKVSKDLSSLRAEQNKEFDTGAQERLMTRIKGLDWQLEESRRANLKLKIGILFVSICMTGYVSYQNSVIFRETVRSIDFIKIQEVAKEFIVSFSHLLKQDYREFIAILRHVNYSNYISKVIYGLSVLIIGARLLKLCLDLPAYIKSVMNISNRWRGAISILLAVCLLAYYKG